jgi:molybdopterin molybdotransferase
MMISVADARQLIKDHFKRPQPQIIPLKNACGLVLAEDILAPIDTPSFKQSAMDGYALRLGDWDGKSPLKIIGALQAGLSQETVKTGSNSHETVRIYTGAQVPDSMDTVVMQEKVELVDGHIHIKDPLLKVGDNVRLKGSQTKAGTLAMTSGQTLNPAAMSYLAGMGITMVNAYPQPKVAIIITGKELVQPGNPLQEGQVYESNSMALLGALQQLGISDIQLTRVDDDLDATTQAIENALSADIVLITGGVSVGDYDFVVPALDRNGVLQVFHKIKQKPGKPFYFGTTKHTMVFALPGNPASVMTCFYEYVWPVFTNFTAPILISVPLYADYTKKPGLTHFVKGALKDNKAHILSHQESYLMNTYAQANCLIELPEDCDSFKAGELVQIAIIP